MLYHALFAVRVLEAEEPFATVAIAAGCRVSAGARKNLVREGGRRTVALQGMRTNVINKDVALTGGVCMCVRQVLASPCTGRSKVHEGFLKVNYITLSPENQLRFN